MCCSHRLEQLKESLYALIPILPPQLLFTIYNIAGLNCLLNVVSGLTFKVQVDKVAEDV